MVNLDVLACSDVQTAGTVLVRHRRDATQLSCRGLAVGQLDADHLNARLALSVYATRQAQGTEAFFVELAVVEGVNLALEVQDVALDYRVFEFCSEALHDGVGLETPPSEWPITKKSPSDGGAFAYDRV